MKSNLNLTSVDKNTYWIEWDKPKDFSKTYIFSMKKTLLFSNLKAIVLKWKWCLSQKIKFADSKRHNKSKRKVNFWGVWLN